MEIKFEIWDPKFKVMYRDDDIVSLDLAKGTYIQDSIQNPVTEGCEELLSEVILRQDTGLKDKSGKSILDGDIIKEESGNIGEVKFSKDLGSCGCCYPRFYGSGFYADDCIIDNKCEIIGNIYEHPELLTNKIETDSN